MEKKLLEHVWYDYSLQSVGILKSDWDRKKFYITRESIAEIYNKTEGHVYFIDYGTSINVEHEYEYGDVSKNIKSILSEIAVKKAIKNPNLQEIVIELSDLAEYAEKIDKLMREAKQKQEKEKIYKELDKLYDRTKFKTLDAKNEVFRAMNEFTEKYNDIEEAKRAFIEFLKEVELKDKELYIKQLENENAELRKKLSELIQRSSDE